MNAMLQAGGYSHWKARVWPTTFQTKGLSIYCQNCKAWVGWARANQKSQPSFMEMNNDGQCAHYNPFPFPEEEESF